MGKNYQKWEKVNKNAKKKKLKNEKKKIVF